MASRRGPAADPQAEIVGSFAIELAIVALTRAILTERECKSRSRQRPLESRAAFADNCLVESPIPNDDGRRRRA